MNASAQKVALWAPSPGGALEAEVAQDGLWTARQLELRAEHSVQIMYAITYAGGVSMTSLSATEARRRLYALIDEVGQSHEPVQIHGKRGNAVLLSEDDWRSIQETLHLVSIPAMRESILEGMAATMDELSSEPGW